MQFKLRFILLFLSSVFSFNIVHAANTASVTNLPVNTVPFRFVITANSGNITPIDGQPNQYQLTLYNVNPYTSFYPRRPSRQMGLAGVTNFIKAWDIGVDNFAQDNPNAVLYAGSMNNQPNSSNVNYIVQVSDPEYSSASNTLSFTITLLGDQRLLFNQLLLSQVILVVN